MNKFDQILSKNEVIFADGATGTNLFEKGLETGYSTELWNVENTKQIKSVHCEFIKAGFISPTGELFSPLGALNHEMAVAAF